MSSRVPPRAAYASLRAYDVEPTDADLHLADNTAPYGPPPHALDVVRRSDPAALVQYPTTYSRSLRLALGRYVGVEPDEIIVGAGSDELLSCAFRALIEPGGVLSYMDPTFVMARVFAETNSLRTVGIPLTDVGDADAVELVRAGTSAVYLCSPNNPTGALISARARELVLREARGLVLFDEAYAEFAGTNVAQEAPSRDGLLVSRTMSKAFGLAGLRVGFAVGERALIAELEKARGPFTVTAVSEAAALAALEHDVEWMRSHAAALVAVRDTFTSALLAAGYRPLPSAANFVLLPVRDSIAAMRALRDRGILVRHFRELAGVGDALRISIGLEDQMRRVLETLLEVVPCS